MSEWVGRRILHYEIRGRLGGGGNGEVYLAHDHRLHRDVAIKRLSAERLSDRNRLRREAEVLAALNHPNIVTVFAIETESGEPFLVMELVEGSPLSRLVPSQGMDPDTALSFGIQLADAVSAAHQAGVLHRDLKPGNILVTELGRVKVLDFGLAEVGDDSTEDEDETISRVASITGTVAYLAPELILGKKATPASDVFAVGVVLYEMVTGRKPFTASSSVELLATIVHDPIPAVQELTPGFPKAFARIIERALAKVPEDRYATAAELAQELKQLELRPIGRRGRKAALGGIGLMLVGALGWFLGSDLGRREPGLAPAPVVQSEHRQRIAVLPFTNLGRPEQGYFAAGMTEELTGRLGAVAELRVLSSTSTAGYQDSGQSPGEVGRRLDLDYVLEGTVRWATAADSAAGRVRVSTRLIQMADDTAVWAGTYDRTLEDIFLVQSEIAEAVIAELGVAIFPSELRAVTQRPTEDLAAYHAYLQGIEYRHQPVAGDSERSVRLLQEAVRRDPSFFLAWSELAHAHAQVHHYGLDRSPTRQALARQAIDRALALAPDSPEVQLGLGYVYYWAERNYPSAIAALDKAAEGLPNDSRLLEAQALILRRLGDFAGSLTKMSQARDLDPLVDRYDRADGVTLYYINRYQEARESLNRAVELAPEEPFNRILQVKLAWQQGDLAESAVVLATLEAGARPGPEVLHLWLRQMTLEGRPEEAFERLLSEPVEVFRDTVRSHPRSLVLAELAHLSGRVDDEKRYAAEALEWIDQALRDNEDPRLYGARGLALAHLGLAEEAVAAGLRGVELLPITRDALNAPHRRLELARIEARVGRHEQALTNLGVLLAAPSEYSIPWLKLDPWFEPLRSLDGYRRLISEAGA